MMDKAVLAWLWRKSSLRCVLGLNPGDQNPHWKLVSVWRQVKTHRQIPKPVQMAWARGRHMALLFVVVGGLGWGFLSMDWGWCGLNFPAVPVPREGVYSLSYWLVQRSRAWSCLWLSIRNGVRRLQGNSSAKIEGWKSQRNSWRKNTPDRRNTCKCPRLGKALNTEELNVARCAWNMVSRGRWG